MCVISCMFLFGMRVLDGIEHVAGMQIGSWSSLMNLNSTRHSLIRTIKKLVVTQCWRHFETFLSTKSCLLSHFMSIEFRGG